MALLVANGRPNQPFAAINYGDVPAGAEIGVAGYPMPTLGTDQNGNLSYGNLIFRVAKGVVTATYLANVHTLLSVPILEVNFLFVPGNSGGPIFDSESSQVVGFVDAFQTTKIRERVEQVTLIQTLPPGMSSAYIENVNALYSLGIKLDRVRPHLLTHGVTL